MSPFLPPPQTNFCYFLSRTPYWCAPQTCPTSRRSCQEIPLHCGNHCRRALPARYGGCSPSGRCRRGWCTMKGPGETSYGNRWLGASTIQKKYGGSEVLVWNQGEVHKVDASIYKGIWHIVDIAICDKTGAISSLGLRDTMRNLCPPWGVDVQHLNTCGHQNPVDHVVLIISTPAWLAWQQALEVFTTKLPIFATSPHEIYPKIGAGPVTLATNSRSECFCPIQSDKIIAWHQTNPRTNASVNKLGWSINGAPHVSIGCFILGCHPSQ